MSCFFSRRNTKMAKGTDADQVLPEALVEIAPILRVADEVEAYYPRVAYLCRFYAFEEAQKLDPASTGRGVSSYKSALLKRLEKEDIPTLLLREKKTDRREIKSIYKRYHRNFLEIESQKAEDKADHTELTKARETVCVLKDVRKSVDLKHVADGLKLAVSPPLPLPPPPPPPPLHR